MLPGGVRYGLLLALVGMGCGPEDEERPPRAAGGCENRSCLPGWIPPDDSSGTAGAGGGGAGSAGVAGAESATELLVSVHGVSDELFSLAAPLAADAMAIGRSPAGDEISVTVPAFESAVLEGIERTRLTWITAVPSLPEFLTTVNPVDTTLEGEQRLLVVAAAPVDTGLLSVAPPLERVAGAAQLIVFVEDSSGLPLSGVTLEHPTAERVAYSAAGSFGSTDAATDESGIVLIANIPALDTGQQTGFVLRSAGQVVSAAAEVLAGAVTMVRIAI